VTPVRLPLLQEDPASEHLALYERSRNAFQDFTCETIGAFLELSLELSACLLPTSIPKEKSA
jgi:hypothetical protein|tara:strand:+ start:7140 stop:7325 length:186 start_codon:yes stop_codon:yes gene_type:complete